DPRTGRFEHFRRDNSRLPSDTAYVVYTDPAGQIWAGTKAGLSRFDVRARTFRPVSFGVDLRAGVGAMATDARAPHVLWMATTKGIVRFDTRTRAVARYATHSDPVRDYPLDLKHDPDDPAVLWITVLRDGLRRFDTRTGRMDAYRRDPADPQGLPDDDLSRLYVDRTGTIWTGAYHGSTGAVRFSPSAGRFVEYDSVERDPNRPQARYVWSVLEDRDGYLWFGTRGPTLTRVDRRTGDRRTWTRELAHPRALLGPPDVNTLLQSRDGAIWIGTRLLTRMDPRTGVREQFLHDPADATSLPPGGVMSLLEDREGRLWVGTRAGLARFDAATRRFERIRLDIPIPESRYVPGLSIRAIRQDRNGALWMTTNAGVVRYDPRTGRMQRWSHEPGNPATITANETYGLLVARDGTVWASGTYSDGLNRIDGRTGRVTHFTTSNSGLPSDGVWGIFEDDAGLLWLSTNTAGVVRFDPRTGLFRSFGEAEGAQAQEFNAGAAYQNPRTGEIFFGGVEGVTAFNPASFTPSRRPPVLALTDLRLYNRVVVPGPESPIQAPLGDAPVVRLRHDQDVVTFEYVGFHAQNPKAVRYRYRLTGFDPRWIDAGTARTATYTNLDAGRYTFQVQAANADGVWSAPASVQVEVLPPWWRTPWSYGLYVLAFGLTLFGGARLHRRRVVEGEREQAAIREAELKAEAAQARLEALDQELAVARRIQQAALPNRLATGAATVHGAMAPAREVGGDFYDYFWLDDDRLAFAVGDVAGKGVPAALFMTVARSVLRSVAAPGIEPGECLRRANRLLYPERIPGVFVTALYGILDTRSGEAQFACAGHFAPLVIRANGRVEAPVRTSGLPLAAVREVAYPTHSVHVSSGDVLLAYT
ncbi:MAG TPA: SpoIIE family protein phosphatase, partial [Rhodothermales bacterium]|nr:SpoIIE family protein phosphatase [Rhodothermales bacterium]